MGSYAELMDFFLWVSFIQDSIPQSQAGRGPFPGFFFGRKHWISVRVLAIDTFILLHNQGSATEQGQKRKRGETKGSLSPWWLPL